MSNSAFTNGGVLLPTGYRGSSSPVYSSGTQFTIASICERDSTDAVNIIKSTSTTVDISTYGLGGIAQSATLAGTGAVVSGLSAVTGVSSAYNSDFIVGDPVYINDTAECRRVSVVGGATSLTVESAWGATDASSGVKRGGRAPNTFYYLYAVSNGVDSNVILSARNVSAGQTLVDLPSGYTYYKQLPFCIRTDSIGNSSVIVPFRVGTGWPWRPKIIYTEYTANNVLPYRALTNGASTSFAAVSLATAVPPISRLADISAYAGSSATAGPATVLFRETGSSLTTPRPIMSRANSSLQQVPVVDMPCDANGSIDYKLVDQFLSFDVYGFTVTEVA